MSNELPKSIEGLISSLFDRGREHAMSSEPYSSNARVNEMISHGYGEGAIREDEILSMLDGARSGAAIANNDIRGAGGSEIDRKKAETQYWKGFLDGLKNKFRSSGKYSKAEIDHALQSVRNTKGWEIPEEAYSEK